MAKVINIVETNVETGISTERTVEGDYRVKLINENSANAFRRLDNGEYDIHIGENYNKIYSDGIIRVLEDDLTKEEVRVFVAATGRTIKYKTGELMDQDGTPTGQGDLAMAAKINYSNACKAINGLVDRGIMAREKRGRGNVLFINPFIAMRGTSISEELLDRFWDTKYAVGQQATRKRHKNG